MDKQIFAALEIADHEIRLLIGEFYNTRFNIIKVERVNVSGVEQFQLVDEEAVAQAIRKAVDNASKMIGARIERVLLCIPSLDMARQSLKISIPIDSIERRVTVLDIRSAMKSAVRTSIQPGLALINAVAIKYMCNGINTRRMPIGELCDELQVDIDLLCANRNVAFSYVNCVEKAGLKILDISLDSFAIAKEAALFEQTVDQNIILIKMERQNTTLALLSKGKLASSLMLEQGIAQWTEALVHRYDLPEVEARRLVKYNIRLNQKHPLPSPIYIWSKDGKTHTLSEKDILDTIREPMENWLNEVEIQCRPILEAGKSKIVIVGEGGELQEIAEYVQERINVETKIYYPETVGVRDSALTTCLGLFYAYKDQLPLIENEEISVNAQQFEKTVNLGIKKEKGNEEESITKKLKGMLFEARQR